MKEFKVKARVEVAVETVIKAASEEKALEIFKSNIAMTASLPDIAEDDYDVIDDAIWDMTDVEVDEA